MSCHSEGNSKINRFSGACADKILDGLTDPSKPAGGASFGQTECVSDDDCSWENGWPLGPGDEPYECVYSGSYLGVCMPPWLLD